MSEQGPVLPKGGLRRPARTSSGLKKQACPGLAWGWHGQSLTSTFREVLQATVDDCWPAHATDLRLEGSNEHSEGTDRRECVLQVSWHADVLEAAADAQDRPPAVDAAAGAVPQAETLEAVTEELSGEAEPDAEWSVLEFDSDSELRPASTQVHTRPTCRVSSGDQCSTATRTHMSTRSAGLTQLQP